MKKIQLMTSVAALVFSSFAFAGDVHTSVAGEKLDSGLGQLSASYTGAEFMRDELRIVGESLDSGLGELSASYTGAEFMRTDLSVVGEKRDSGLGEVTKEDITILMILSSL